MKVNIINSQLYVVIIVKDPTYYKIGNILVEMGIELYDTSNIEEIYDNPQIYKIDIYYHNDNPYINIYYIDRDKKYIDEFEVTPDELKTFLITNYNNYTIDLGKIY
jgi:hypothetical protein